MDKRLLKSLTTAKARYENQIADAQAKLHMVNSMLESMNTNDLPPQPVKEEAQATQQGQPETVVPAFLKKNHDKENAA